MQNNPMGMPPGGGPQMMNIVNPQMPGNQSQGMPPPQPGMGMPPPQEKKPSLKVTLNDKEKGYYSNLLMQADPSGNNKVGGQQGVAFFKRSGIPTDVLKQIWLTSARTSNEFLTRDEFYVALRLIAYAQNGIQPNEDSIRFNIDVAFPKFEQASLALPPSEAKNPEIRAEDIAAALPDLDSLDIGALNNIQSLIPSVHIAEQQKQMQQQQNQMMRQQQMMQRQMMERAKQSPWFIQQEDQQRYLKIFQHFDSQNRGFLIEQEMRGVFDQTKLEKDLCDTVWRLVNPRNAEKFDRKMFMIAMHYLYKVKQGGVQLPQVLPEETFISLDGEQYFANLQQRQHQQQFMPHNQMPQQFPQQMPPQQQMPQQHQQMPQQIQQQQMPQQMPPQQPPNMQQQQQIQKPSIDPQSITTNDELMGFSFQQPQSRSGSIVKNVVQQQEEQKVPMNNNQSLDFDLNFSGINLPNGNGSGQKPQQFNNSPAPFQQQQISPPKKIVQFNENFGLQPQPNQNNMSKSQHQSPRNSSIGIQLMKIDPSKIQFRKDELNFATSIQKQDNQLLIDIQSENQKILAQLNELDEEFLQIKRKIEQQRKLIEQEKERNQKLKHQLEEKTKQVQGERQIFENLLQDRLTNLEQQSNNTHNNQGYDMSYNKPQDGYGRKDSYSAHNSYSQGGQTNYSQQNYGVGSNDYYQDTYSKQQHQDYSNNYDYGYSQQQHYNNSNNYGNEQYSQQMHSYDNNNQNQAQQNHQSSNIKGVASFDFDNFDNEILNSSTIGGFNGRFDFS